MYSKTDARDRGKGAPPTRPTVEGYKRRYRDQRYKKSAVTRPARVTFSGLTEDLKGHIYDVGTISQADQFTATTKALGSYSGRKCTDPQDIIISIERPKDVVIPIPHKRTDIKVDVAKILPGKYIDGYVKRSQQYRNNKANIYSVAIGQCTEAMQNSLEGEKSYEDIDEELDVIRLLLLIKSITYSSESKSYPVMAIHMEMRGFYSTSQSNSSSCDKCFETMNNLRDVISHCGGVFRNHPFLINNFLKADEAYFFISLTNRQRLNQQIFTSLPLPQDETNAVHRLAHHNP